MAAIGEKDQKKFKLAEGWGSAGRKKKGP